MEGAPHGPPAMRAQRGSGRLFSPGQDRVAATGAANIVGVMQAEKD